MKEINRNQDIIQNTERNPSTDNGRGQMASKGSEEADLAYVKGRFDSDELAAPENLSVDAITAMVAGIKQEGADAEGGSPSEKAVNGADHQETAGSAGQTVAGTKKGQGRLGRRKGWMRPAMAVAACLFLVLGLSPMLPDFGPARQTADKDEGQGAAMETFKNYGELDAKVAALFPPEGSLESGEILDYDVYYEGPDTLAANPGSSPDGEVAKNQSSVGENTASRPGGQGGNAHSDTYVQVAGIDEADIVKTDGKYIYFVSDVDNSIVIARAHQGKATQVARLDGGDSDTYIHNLYIAGDRLVIIGSEDFEDPSVYSGDTLREATRVVIYDMADKENIREVTSYAQSGYLVASRLNGDRLYLVTGDQLTPYRHIHYYPCVDYGGTGMKALPIGNVTGFPDTVTPAFTTVGSLDIAAGTADADTVTTKALLGGAENVYCSAEALYITTTVYPEYGKDGYYMLPNNDQVKTGVVKVDLSGEGSGKLAMSRPATVTGTVNNQFSMDDAGGVFKIATTGYRDGQDVNHLYLFDEDMELLGSLKNFGKDEHIEAVRYVGDLAYVITYEEIDPLFIIDLSDPTNPTMLGHVKISGFSTLLVPAGDEHLLGFGYGTAENEWGEAIGGVKLALFDISDPAAPKVADEMAFDGWASEVQTDHKALLVSPDAAYYAFPYEVERSFDGGDDVVIIEDGDDLAEVAGEEEMTVDAVAPGAYQRYERCGILVVAVRDGKIVREHDFVTEEPVRRCLYIGDYIYGICEDDSIQGFGM